ncbi:MAG: hypothetical protein KKF56_04160 [Nanoarchaeota archaeon]|nr:hypothetical protein [Nanoarchaeota archaeon]
MKKKVFIIGIIVVLIIILIGVVGYKNGAGNGSDENICVKQQTSCCSCDAGGTEECMTKQKAEVEQERLANDCPGAEELICAQVYRCNDKQCVNKDGKCVLE